jgi:hypothetical protein
MTSINYIKGSNFSIGERDYNCVIIPPGLENLNTPTYNLLKSFLSNNGKVISLSDTKICIDGSFNNSVESLDKQYPEQWLEVETISDLCEELILNQEISFLDPEKISGKLFHHRRELEDGQILFLVNTSLEEWSEGELKIKGSNLNEMDLINGDIKAYPFEISNDMLIVNFDLPPAGSLLLKIDNTPAKTIYVSSTDGVEKLEATNEVRIEKTNLNALTIDYCDLKVGNISKKDLYFFNAADELFKYYGFNGNPWSRAVQYKTSIIEKSDIPNNSGFEVTYKFSIENGTDLNILYAAIEQPDLWDLKINGVNVNQISDTYLGYRTIGKSNIVEHIKIGMNTIT